MIIAVFPNWAQGSICRDKAVKVRWPLHIKTELANRNNQPAYIMTELSLQPKRQQSTMEDIIEVRAANHITYFISGVHVGALVQTSLECLRLMDFV